MKIPVEIKRNNEPIQYFQLNWMLHDRCTYKCSYCAPSNYAGLDDWLDLEKVINFCNQTELQVKNLYPDLKMQVIFSGGEPTVWKDFKKLVQQLYKNEWSLHLVTNASRSLSWWKDVDVVWDYLGLSLHSEFVDIDSFIEKCYVLQSKTNLLCIRVMLHPEERLFYKSIAYAIKIQEKIPLAVIQWVPISYNFGGIDIDLPSYTEQQTTIIKDLIKKQKKHKNHNYKLVTWNTSGTDIVNGNHLIAAGLNNFKGWSCNSGIDGIFIDSRGKIYRGTCLEGGSIGTILDSKILLYDKPIVCQKNSCTCVADVLYSKKKL